MSQFLIIRRVIPWFGAGAIFGYVGNGLVRDFDIRDYSHPDSVDEGTIATPEESDRTKNHAEDFAPHYPVGFSYPAVSNIVIREAFTTSMNYRTKIPDWVAEKLTADTINGRNGERKHASFKPDTDIREEFRASNADYWDSGWSRGHLAASASHKLSQEGQNSTFLLNSNIVPQDLSMNGCDWNRLEMLVRDVTKNHPKGTVYVLSGPVWIPDVSSVTQRLFSKNNTILHEVVGSNNVYVPTHMFKIIRLDNGPDSASAAFIIPNRPILTEEPLESYKVSIETLEKNTGIDMSGFQANTDLCTITQCEKTTNRRMLGWRHYGFIDLSKNVQELQSSVINAVDAGFVDGDNFLIPKAIRDRMRDLNLGEEPENLFPDNEKYRTAVSNGFEVFKRKSVVSTE